MTRGTKRQILAHNEFGERQRCWSAWSAPSPTVGIDKMPDELKEQIRRHDELGERQGLWKVR